MRDTVATCKYVRSRSSFDSVSRANKHFSIRVPGEAGRLLVQTYFEAEHADTAVIHPEDKSPLTPPAPTKKPNRFAPRIGARPRAQMLLRREIPGRAPNYGPQPTYGPLYKPAAPPHPQLQPRYGLARGMGPGAYGQSFGGFPTHGYPYGAPSVGF